MRTHFRLYKYLIMSFELTNTPATFQTYINNVLREYLDMFVVVYLNNILIYSKNKHKHWKHIREVLITLQKVNLRIKSEKS